MALLREYSHADPCTWSVPEFVIMFITEPEARPKEASYTLFWILNSCTISGGGSSAKLLLFSALEIMPSINRRLLPEPPPDPAVTEVVEA